MQTVPIQHNSAFQRLEQAAQGILGAAGYKLLRHRGSSSWVAQDAARKLVLVKLYNFPHGFFFGLRKRGAGPLTATGNPSPVVFYGEYVCDDEAGRATITRIAEHLPV